MHTLPNSARISRSCATSRISAYGFLGADLKDFIDDAVERGILDPSQYLIAVMGGMEIWGGAQGASLTGFTAEVQE